MASIDYLTAVLLISAVLVLAGILSSLVAYRVGAPLLLVFLLIGMLAGEDGPGGIAFDDYRTTYLFGSLALAVILFDGGLRTPLDAFRVALRPSVLLATVGVVVTAVITATGAIFIFEQLSFLEALLLASIVASTDAAAVFFLLHAGGLQLKQRVGATLEIESSTNDPVAILMTVALTQYLSVTTGEHETGWAIAAMLVQEAVIGGAFGIAGGMAISLALNRLPLPPGLNPLFASTSAIVTYAGTAALGGSGFLAVYLAGVVLGNRRTRGGASLLGFQEAVTWFCQIVMFVLLGLLATPSRMLEHTLGAVLVALVLMLVARPAAVWLCLRFFRFSPREMGFVAWVGLRGAVAIYLASVPMLASLPNAFLYFDVAFVVVLISLVVQGWTIPPVARRLGVTLPPLQQPAMRVELDLPGQLELEMVGYPVPSDSAILRGATLPHWARLAMVVRNERILVGAETGPIAPGDYVYLLAPPDRVRRLDRFFTRPQELPPEERDFFGEFVFDGTTTLGAIARTYGFPVPPEDAARRVSDHFAERLNEHPVVGDRLALGPTELIVREVDGDRVTKVGLEIDPKSEEAPAQPGATPAA
jgi:cell volume regulation protein A